MSEWEGDEWKKRKKEEKDRILSPSAWIDIQLLFLSYFSTHLLPIHSFIAN